MPKWVVNLSTFDLRYEPRSTIISQELAYFMAYFSTDIEPEAKIELKQLQDEDEQINGFLYTNRASNSRVMGLGFVLKSP